MRVYVFVCLLVVVAGEGWKCPPLALECNEDGYASDEKFFRINGTQIMFKLSGDYYASMSCNGLAVDDSRLPVLRVSTAVLQVHLQNCAPPSTSYVEALAARNLTFTEKLLIFTKVFTPFTNKHFEDLPAFLTLHLMGTTHLAPDEDFLANTGLGSLKLTNVAVTGRMLELLPTSLRSLTLEETNVTSVPPEAMSRLMNLSSLIIRQSHELSLDLNNSTVKILHVRGGVAGLPTGPLLEKATFQELRGLKLLGDCSSLVSLSISLSQGGDLWLAPCPRLTTLSVYNTPVSMRPGALENLRDLKDVILRDCSLTELPLELLKTNSKLTALDVSKNNLTSLPFLPPALDFLDASSNNLGPEGTQSVVSLTKLQTLRLAKNNLGDACGNKRSTSDSVDSNDVSLWSRQPLLSMLDLSYTGVTRLCADWRRAHRLIEINLRHNNITRLNYYDMQWARSLHTTVDLRDNPIKSIYYEYEDYLEAIKDNRTEAQMTELDLPDYASCDCEWYWYVRAKREAPYHAPRINRIRCDKTSALEVRYSMLQTVKPSLLSCPIENISCPESCRCVYSDAPRVFCEDAGLLTFPALDKDIFEYVVEMRLRGNEIEDVPLDLLPPRLEVLDISDNLISFLPEEVTSALSNVNISVASNPLQCDCSGKPFIHYLYTNKQKVLDFRYANCSDGRLIHNILPSDLCSLISVGTVSIIVVCCVAFSALLAVAIILAAWKWLPDRLQRKLAFIARPFNFTIAEEEKEYKFDVFVSHAHADWSIGKKVATIAEDAGMRACVHWRDWPPGGRISAQIAASVTSSRKTAILLSSSYIDSPWARAELTAALANPQRVLIIRLEATTDVPAELELFVNSHTYLDWRDSRFKEKLIGALQPHKKVKCDHKRIPVGDPLDIDKDGSPYKTGNDVTFIMDDINHSGSINSQTMLNA